MSLGHRPSRGFTPDPPDDFSVDRLRWIIRLRWIALCGILLAAALAALGFYPGVSWQVLALTATGAGIYNGFLHVRHAEQPVRGSKEAVRQAIVDMAILTVVLWAAGGMRTPFIGYYVFHVAIVGILGGKQATVTATVAALLGSTLLLVSEHVPALQIGRWDPAWPFDLLAEITAFITTVGSMAYLVRHAADQLRRREKALADARAEAALELQILTNTLDELDAGLEVVEGDGTVIWRNKRAEELAPAVPHDIWTCPGEERACEQDVTGICPVKAALEQGEAGHCRFAARIDGTERVYEMNSYPLGSGEDDKRLMNLYVDRSSTLIAERRLILAERLASLGRVTQGVAHELNTPLATIRTLSADMLAALREERADDRVSLLEDLSESAALVHDETRRLGKITQGLLTGRDLTASDVSGSVPLPAVVERARALVFAGARESIPVRIDDLSKLAVRADRDHLVQVLVNLLQNAYDAVREAGGGAVHVHAHRAGRHVELVIDDEGLGVPETIRSRLFEPFATSKPPGKGTGLGLYTSYMLVDAMQGRLALEPREAGGTRATVSIPAADGDLVQLRTPEAPEAAE